MVVNKITLIILFCAITITGLAQNKQTKKERRKAQAERVRRLIEQEAEGTIIFNRQNVFGLRLNTDGYGLLYEHGRQKSIRKSNLYWIELGEKKHPQEEKMTSINTQNGTTGNPYVLGKVNNLYFVKLGFAQSYLLGGKGNKNGVAITAIYGGGFTAGLLKPYYLKVADPTSPDREKDVRYQGADTIYFAGSGQGSTIGSSGFTKGFSKIEFVPGFHGRLAVRFDYGRFNEVVSALEAGVTADFFTKEMPILAHTEHKRFFFNAYVSLVFGKRR